MATPTLDGSSEADPIYTPLQETRDKFEFRLLEILDAPNDGVISCRLSKTAFGRGPNWKSLYIALSYVWGDIADPETISLNGKPWTVTKNLASALRHIKKHSGTLFPDAASSQRFFWIDALCINQQDVEERANQVMMMRQIYNHAGAVFAWLGGEGEDGIISLALDTISLLGDIIVDPNTTQEEVLTLRWLQRCPQLNQDEEGDPGQQARWNSLQKVFHLPYWSRIWIFQEAVMANYLYVACPSRILKWPYLEEVAGFMNQMRLVIEHYPIVKPAFVNDNCWFHLSLPTINWVNVNMISKTQRHLAKYASSTDETTETKRAQAILALNISGTGGNLRATDPKDHIYGLMGLSGMQITPDYRAETSYIDVYCDYVSHCLGIFPEGASATSDELNELWFLKWAGAIHYSTERPDFPSWAPNYPVCGEHQGTEMSTISNDSTWSADVGVFDISHSPLAATKPVVDGRILRVVGVPIQHVKTLGASIVDDISETQKELREYFVEFCARYDGQEDILGMPPLQALFRVWIRFQSTEGDGRNYTSSEEIIGFLQFVLDIGGNMNGPYIFDMTMKLGRKPREQFDDWIMRTFSPGIKDTLGGQDWLNSLVHIDPSSALDGLSRHGYTAMQLQKAGGSQYIETDGGRLGLAPRCALPGDVIAVLKGYSMPVVIRKTGDHYTFIGACYVLGYMEGEARTLVDQGIEKVEVLEFR